jgi:DNA primase
MHPGTRHRQPRKSISEAGLDLLRLGPVSGRFSDAAEAGCLLQELLDKLGLKSFPKTSGSRGLHVFVPIRVGPAADEILKFAEKVVARLASKHPKLLTTEHSIAARGSGYTSIRSATVLSKPL